MLLLELPAELLRNIIHQSIPEGFENVMLSCRTIYECGHAFVNDYNRKRKECRAISFNVCDSRNALYWLHRIAEEPGLSHYMREADLKGYKAYMRCGTPGVFNKELRKSRAYLEFPQLKESEATLQRIRELITSSAYLGGDVDFWTRAILSDLGDADHYIDHDFFAGVFFLTLLPNARTLTLPWNHSYIPSSSDAATNGTRHYEDVLDRIQQKARGAAAQAAALGQVRRLEFLLQADYDVKASAGFLAPLLVLPRLEELYATSLVATQPAHAFAWKHPGVFSNLRSIELVHCALDAGGVSELLAHTPRLEAFAYSHACKHHGVGAYWDAGAFVAAVGRHAGGRLRRLAVTTEVRGLNEVLTGVTSMREFARLETLEAHYAYFCAPSVESGEQAFLGVPPRPGYERWTVGAVPPLRQILPGSLRRLVLFVEPNSYCPISGAKPLFPLFDGFASARSEAFPGLESCEVYCRGEDFGSIDDGRDAVHEYLKDEGVRCYFGDRLEPPWRSAFRAQFGL
ncbi:hypothetical protein F4775DRAFT_604632 [Biscogniauxia sp. FL1348]|nr:hypothetical protein F4775DRAFT_604632 [Biscogniauxia sp. FL1348]